MGADRVVRRSRRGGRAHTCARLARAALGALAVVIAVAGATGGSDPGAAPRPAIGAVGNPATLAATTPSAATPDTTHNVSRPVASPEPTAAAQAAPAPAPVIRPRATDPERCRETAAVDSKPACYYVGPLFDAHFHPASGLTADARTPSRALCDLLSRHGVTWGLALYELPPSPASDAHAARMVAESQSCAVFLVQPMYASSAGPRVYAGFRRGDYSAALLRSWLRPRGNVVGVGELALYFPELHGVSLDSPSVRTALEAVDRIAGVVMVHPRLRGTYRSASYLYPNQTTAEEIAAAALRYPRTTFVIHGGLPVWDMVMPLFDSHPNIYFSYDTVFWLIEAGISWRGSTPVQFAQRFDAYGLDRLVARTLDDMAPRLAQHPDRVLWGQDRYEAWHFHVDVSSRWVEAARLVIARLPAEAQAQYAYENALELFGRFLDPPRR